MSKTKYVGVYLDKKGSYFYQTELGTDEITGKRIQKKSRYDSLGRQFNSAHSAYEELTRVKRDYQINNGYSNYDLNYVDFIDTFFLPFYKSSVEKSTYQSHIYALNLAKNYFKRIKVREIKIADCERYRLWLINKSGFSLAYSSLVYGKFRQSLNYAVTMQFLSKNVSKNTLSIPKKKSIVPFWTRHQFEQVLSTFCVDDFYDHMCFVMIWFYYMTGVRVSEGLALNWSDIDFTHKKARIHHTLEMKNHSNFVRKPYTKTYAGLRTISLDDDTIHILRDWKQEQESHGITHYIMSINDLPLYRSTVSRTIHRHAKLAHVPEIQGKGLRHSHVSYLINEFNASVLLVSKRLGHSSPEITLKHYAHLWSRNDEELAEMMTGNIHYTTAEKPINKFNGNQSIKFPANNLPK
ncbi:tyrosine-type recombinase/integrase [Companilactobacillus sp.]|uniref:tyrosine-type recombinase/integrase n=1 Tax=Companilactobacillus sp. TaxID=2767905 RepID=UPI0025C33DA1|nr:site-specific integrase [Companilactobacillus sp.]MCH4009646.1 site-specific integrase [Companilactobacillus sp.]MCH4052678.1 site-specific integrase [Companilactobacillus sp.]MCH4077588.1 site-specific integrase [Companilactobacillus sp.]MCH4126164.1 site-specific integrase [Companilactobacillus sp.]MCI1311872.1 site-specific integrase [Companilactobacillus sp.]